ncbi:MAG TPA: peptidase M61 [Caulobacteraceae bacterium]|jgi:predicted metalloprotease with PDZ domain
MKSALVTGACAAILLGAVGAWAQSQPLPQPAPPTPAIAGPQDIAYPGVIRLQVDATDLPHGIFTVHETVPVAGSGPLTLLYPEWIPGEHSPTGTIDKLASLIITAGGKRVEWKRDPVNVYAFHVDVPAGANAVDVDFQYLSAVSSREGRVQMTPQLINLKWNNVALYPAGYFSRGVTFEPSVKLPAGFHFGTALEPASTEGDTTVFKPVPFNTLVDSPLIAGEYFKRIDLDPGGPAAVHLDVIADHAQELDATPAQIEAHKSLVRQAYRLFQSHHYDHYDFLLWLSDRMTGEGLEHHQSSEDGTDPKYFTDWDATAPGRDLLAHEYTHSWNGKFRRPADLWTPSFNVPMRDSLLWVYEGQTQYWGYVLAARSGLETRQEILDAIALTAATYDARIGRTWRAVEDTTNDPIIAERRPLSWLSWQRSEDYYSEGQLIWLDADTLIRQLSGGRRSLDDFAAKFFGVDNGSFVTAPYTFDDVVAALNAVQPYDWATFLHERLNGHGPGAPLDGLTRGGYKLVYTDVESRYLKDAEEERKFADFSFSVGLTVSTRQTGDVTQVIWDSPAFKAGLTSDSKILAVNGDVFSVDGLKSAIKAAVGGAPLELVVQDKDEVRTLHVDYRGGLRYPHLEKTAAHASLDDILTPRS